MTSCQLIFRRCLRFVALSLMVSLGGCLSIGTPEEKTISVEAAVETTATTAVTSSTYHASGVEHFQAGEYGLAEKSFRDAVEANPKDTKSWLGLAAAYDRLKRFDMADEAYNRALALEPNSAVAWNNLGFSHLLRGNLKNASRALKRALELDGGDPLIQRNVDLLYAARRGPRGSAG